MLGRWTVVAAVVVGTALAACGGSGTGLTGGDPAASTPGLAADGAATPDTAGAVAGGATGSDSAPVTIAIDDTAWGFDIGTCDVSDDSIQASAGRADGTFASADVRISQDGGAVLQFNLPAPGGATTLQLAGGDAVVGTSWEPRVEGTTAVIDAVLADQGASGGEPVAAVVTIRCAERGFGGMAAPAVEEPVEGAPEPAAEEPAITDAGGATISLDLGGSLSTFDYFGCPLTESELMFVVVTPEMTRLAVLRGEVRLDLGDGTRYRADGVAFDGPTTGATWTGTLASPAGDLPATITIACG